MPKDARSESEKARDLANITRMYWKEGKTQQQIAEELHLSQPTVSRDLAKLRKQHAAQAMKDLERWQQDRVIELRLLRVEAWEAWETSKTKGKEIRTSEVRGGKEFVSLTAESPTPDSRYLAVIDKSILTEHKVLGLDKVTVVFNPQDLMGMSDDELKGIVNG